MSFIPSRDVFEMTEEQNGYANNLFDEIEAEYLDHFAEDEFGKGWTFERARNEPNYKNWYPDISGYNILVYLINRKEWNAEQ